MLLVLRFRGTQVSWAYAEIFGEDAHEGRSATTFIKSFSYGFLLLSVSQFNSYRSVFLGANFLAF